MRRVRSAVFSASNAARSAGFRASTRRTNTPSCWRIGALTVLSGIAKAAPIASPSDPNWRTAPARVVMPVLTTVCFAAAAAASSDDVGAELAALLVGFEQRLLDQVGRVQLTLEPHVQLEPRQHAQVLAVILQGPLESVRLASHAGTRQAKTRPARAARGRMDFGGRGGRVRIPALL